MSPLLAKVLADATQLKPQEQLQLVSHLMNIWQQSPHLNEVFNQISTDKTTTNPTLSRKHLFGCMKGKIKMAPDFDAPLMEIDWVNDLIDKYRKQGLEL
jgi:hypothetical protein